MSREARVAATLALATLVAACKSKSSPPPPPPPEAPRDAAVIATGRLVLEGCTPALPVPHGARDPLAPPPSNADPGVDKQLGAMRNTPGAKDFDDVGKGRDIADVKQRPQVLPGEPTVTGKLGKDQLRRAVVAIRDPLADCYAKALARDPKLTGELSMRFMVGPTGKVAQAKAAAADAKLGACFVEKFQQAAFPVPTAGAAQVTIAFQLRPPDPAAPPATPPAPGSAGSATPAPLPVTAKEWTPYARIPYAVVPGLVERTRAAITAKLGQLQLCAGSDVGAGSLRAMLQVTPQGTVAAVRAGGLGDAKAQICVAAALQQLETGKPDPAISGDVELACDFHVDAAKPWRVAREDGYTQFIVAKDVPLPQPTGDHVALVIAAPDVPFEHVGKAIAAASAKAPVTLVAAHDGTLVGVGRATVDTAPADSRARIVALAPGQATACLDESDTDPVPAALTDAAALTKAIGSLACGRACTDAIVVHPAIATPIGDLATLRAALPSLPIVTPAPTKCAAAAATK